MLGAAELTDGDAFLLGAEYMQAWSVFLERDSCVTAYP
jgi:hypothetical protein